MVQRALAVILALFAFANVQAEERYVEGQHYTVLETPLKTTYRGEEIGEIVEFFSYNCIHCYNLEGPIKRFLEEKPDNIRFTPIPVMFNERQAPEVRAYYVVKTLKLGEEAHEKIYNAIHKERRSLRSDKQFAKFFEDEFDISEDKYMATAYSFGVDPQVRRSVQMTGNSRIGGTPTLMVNGKYIINSAAVGGNEMALYAAKWLVERDAAAQ